jgi:hypothetical protein
MNTINAAMKNRDDAMSCTASDFASVPIRSHTVPIMSNSMPYLWACIVWGSLVVSTSDLEVHDNGVPWLEHAAWRSGDTTTVRLGGPYSAIRSQITSGFLNMLRNPRRANTTNSWNAGVAECGEGTKLPSQIDFPPFFPLTLAIRMSFTAACSVLGHAAKISATVLTSEKSAFTCKVSPGKMHTGERP